MEQALSVIRRGVLHYGQNFEIHYKYQEYIEQMLIESKKQTKIDDYFQKK